MTAVAERAPVTASPEPSRRASSRRRHGRAAPWLLPAVAVLVQVYFLVIADRTSPSLQVGTFRLPGRTALPLIGLLGTAGLVALGNARGRMRADPVTLSITALLSLTVGFPIAHLPHDRLVGYGFVLAALTMTGSAFRERPLVRRLPKRAPAGVLIGGLVVITLLSPDAGGMQQLLLMAGVGVPLYVLPQLEGRDRLPDIARVVIALAAVQSVIALLEPAFWPQHLWAGIPVEDLGADVARPLVNTVLPNVERSQGTLGHPLPLGLLLVVAIALLLRVRTGLPYGVRVALLGLFLAGVVVAGDRNALLIALALLVWGGRLSAKRLAGGLVVLLLGVVVLIDVGVLSGAVFDELLNSGSYLHRVQAYSLIGSLLYTQSPLHVFLGNGFASTPRMFALGRLQNDGLEVVDNSYVLMQSQGGLVCLLALVTLVGSALATCRRELRPAVAALALVMLIFDYLLWPSATALLFMMLGLAFRDAGADDRRQA